jgi:hypothetical protein
MKLYNIIFKYNKKFTFFIKIKIINLKVKKEFFFKL